ncbi:hypothetical protein GGX14DRAFT_592934 [Mycena pura]|uniref:Uncharacterized protein n=1 Tax=Mycena pura TaxID=153505 RepID=A0AAD6URM7_9AGAR|nr:hypothetical protein GGX14DRAFT_592934 [Mycena pura]
MAWRLGGTWSCSTRRSCSGCALLSHHALSDTLNTSARMIYNAFTTLSPAGGGERIIVAAGAFAWQDWWLWYAVDVAPPASRYQKGRLAWGRTMSTCTTTTGRACVCSGWSTAAWRTQQHDMIFSWMDGMNSEIKMKAISLAVVAVGLFAAVGASVLARCASPEAEAAAAHVVIQSLQDPTLCITATGDSLTSPTILTPCNSSDSETESGIVSFSQVWTVNPLGANVVQFQNVDNNQCFAQFITDPNTNGLVVTIEPCVDDNGNALTGTRFDASQAITQRKLPMAVTALNNKPSYSHRLVSIQHLGGGLTTSARSLRVAAHQNSSLHGLCVSPHTGTPPLTASAFRRTPELPPPPGLCVSSYTGITVTGCCPTPESLARSLGVVLHRNYSFSLSLHRRTQDYPIFTANHRNSL